jgi:hypothetical protein
MGEPGVPQSESLLGVLVGMWVMRVAREFGSPCPLPPGPEGWGYVGFGWERGYHIYAAPPVDLLMRAWRNRWCVERWLLDRGWMVLDEEGGYYRDARFPWQPRRA